MKPVTGDLPRGGPAAALPETGAPADNASGRGIGALLISASVSRLADQSASIALVLLVIARTHNPRLAGLVVAAFTVPTLVTGPVIGAYLDQLKAKRALFAANQVTLAAALTGVAVLAGHAPGAVLIAGPAGRAHRTRAHGRVQQPGAAGGAARPSTEGQRA